MGIRYRNVRLHIDVVVGDDLPFAFIFHDDLQQARAEASLVIHTCSGRQLLKSSYRREHFYDGNSGLGEFEGNDVLSKGASVELSFENIVVSLNERLTPGEELPLRERQRSPLRGLWQEPASNS
jgi:hypothetical protein